MEENREVIKNILNRASTPETPVNLSQSILNAWKEEEKALVIAPLIPKPIWIGLGIAILGLCMWILTAEPTEASPSTMGHVMKQFSSAFSFDVSISPVVLLSIMAMACMIWLNVLIVNGRISFGRLTA